MTTKISKDTIVRTVLLFVALVNQLLTATGHSVLPFDDDTITEIVSALFTAVTAIAAWWKNNSFTLPALKADKVLEAEKEEAE